MKYTLVIIRHSKTETQHFGQEDFDRNLTEQGIEDAKKMAERLKHVHPDLMIASTANRTQQTAKIFAQTLGYDSANIDSKEKLYQCSSATIQRIVTKLSDAIKTCYIIAHNPGVSDFVYDIQKDEFIGSLPTSGCVVFEFEATSWSDFTESKKTLTFDYPKK
jgi:phosphohistidine phosphatase